MSNSPRSWYRPRLRTIAWAILLTLVALPLYSYWSDYAEKAMRRNRELLSPIAGSACTVVLRRELLGIERMAPHPATVNGVDNSVRGRFVQMNDQWLVLGGMGEGQPEQWIPRENVLVIQVDRD